MLNRLLELGLSMNTIKHMTEINNDLNDMSEKDFDDKVNLLESINCNSRQIMEIISSNASVFSVTNNKLKELFIFLTSVGFSNLNILFNSNPDILNLEAFEVKNYFEKEMKQGKLLDDIVDQLESDTLLFNEM